MPDYDDNKVEIIESNKGGLKLIFRGYMYTVHKRRTNGAIRWRCTQRSMFCKGSITTFGQNSNLPPTPNMPHNHVPDPYSVAMARSRRVRSSADKVFDDEPYDEEEASSKYDIKLFDNPPEIDIFDKPELHVEVIMDPPKLNQAEMPSTPPILTPVKVSQRILSQKAQQLAQQHREQQVQKDNAKDPLEMVQKQASASLTVRKVPDAPRAAPPPDEDEVCLRWNSHYSNMQSVFPSLLAREQFVDVTLCSEGQSIRCHKLVLSACSPYFEDIISNMTPWQHPVIFLKGMPFWVLKALIDYMYVGETSIEQSKLKIMLEAGEELKIKGLAAKAPAQTTNFSFRKPTASPPLTQITTTKISSGTTSSSKVYKVGLTKEQLMKFSSDEMHKMINHQQLPIQQQVLQRLAKPDVPKKEHQEHLTIKDQHAKKLLKTVVLKNKRPPKRRLSETSSPVPEQLLFVRKGTKSRPLVKTPRFYHTEFEDDSKPAKVEKHEKAEVRHTPNYTDPIDDEMSLQKPKRRDLSMDFKIVDIKQEPLDIGETDVSFAQAQELLSFDNQDEERPPAEKKTEVDVSLIGITDEGEEELLSQTLGFASGDAPAVLSESAKMLELSVAKGRNKDSCDFRGNDTEEVDEN